MDQAIHGIAPNRLEARGADCSSLKYLDYMQSHEIQLYIFLMGRALDQWYFTQHVSSNRHPLRWNELKSHWLSLGSFSLQSLECSSVTISSGFPYCVNAPLP